MEECCKEIIRKLMNFEHRRMDRLDSMINKLEEKPQLGISVPEKKEDFINIIVFICYREEAKKMEDHLRNVLIGRIKLL